MDGCREQSDAFIDLMVGQVPVAEYQRLQHCLATLAGMRRILMAAVTGVLLIAIGTRAAEALRVGGPRLRCACTEACWCKRPALTVFRWVTPGRWHLLGLAPEEKRSQHS